jgi:hypothetical protein
METRMRVRIGLAAAIAGLALSGAACAQPHGSDGGQAASGGRTVDLQGDPRAFVDNRHMRAFYALSVETFGKGTRGVDVAAYEQKAFAIFRALGAERGPSAEAMQDHLKLIPRQVVKIVQDDPHVLDSFDNFADALIGPR